MSNPGPGAQPVVVYVDGDPVSALNPLPTSGGGGGGGTVDQGAANGDAAKGWSVRLTDGSAFVVPAKTGQLPSALGATTAASSLAVGIATDQLSTLATATLQTTGNSSLTSILGQLDAKTSILATETTLSAAKTLLGAGLPAALVGGKLDVNLGTASITLPVSAASLPLPAGAATSALQGGGLPAALVGGRLDANIGAWLGSTAPTVGQKTAANSLPVVLASDTGTLTVATSATAGSSVAEAVLNCSSAQILLPSTAAPKVRKIYNRAGNGRLFIRYGSAPTAETDCNFAIGPGDTWEMPVLAPGVLEYAGAVYGLIPSGASTAHGLQVT